MPEYRTGNHHGVTINREGDGFRCGWADHDCDRGHIVAVVVNGDRALAERICALLNGDEQAVMIPADSCTCPPGYGSSTAPDPHCVVHQGRRARGPKPPPVGEGCVCDGSGRRCPRHGVVI